MEQIKKRIMVLVPSIGIGGRERIALNTVDCLKKSGYEVFLVIFQNREKEYQTDIEYINLDIPASGSKIGKIVNQIKRAFVLKKMRKELQIDFVYSFGAAANLANVLSKTKSNGKSVVAVHGFAEVNKSVSNNRIFKKADRIVCISQDMQYHLLKIYPALTATVVIENGYNVSEALKDKNNTSDYNAGSPKLVAMGRFSPVKGFDRLIEAFDDVQKEINRASLTFIGDGETLESCKKQVEEKGIQDKVNFLGYKDDPYSCLLTQDIYVLSSRNEGFPNAIIEAMACGLAVVAVDCLSGPREILSEKYSTEPVSGIVFEKYGVLVENAEYDEKLAKLISQAVLGRIKKNAVSRYQSIGRERAAQFSLDRYCEKINGLFEELSK